MAAVKVDGWKKGKNDCLEHILVNQGYSVEDIYKKGPDGKSLLQNVADQNGMKDPNLLRPGQTLNIMPKEAAEKQAAAKAKGEPVDTHPELRGPQTELGKGVDQAGEAVVDAGKAISGAGGWLQGKVEQGAKWLTDRVDKAAEEDKKGLLGQTEVGRGVIEAQKTVGHFAGGLIKGVASLGTGLVSAAGGVVQLAGGATRYAVNDHYAAEVNDTVAKVAEDPGAIARNIGGSIKEAWDKDHADFLGQAVGVVGGTVATLGLGAARGAGAVAQGTELATAGRAGARGAEFASKAGRVEAAADGVASAFRMPASSADALSTLGLKPGATAQEIKSAYRGMASKYHPDHNPSPHSTANFQAIQAAYSMLK